MCLRFSCPEAIHTVVTEYKYMDLEPYTIYKCRLKSKTLISFVRKENGKVLHITSFPTINWSLRPKRFSCLYHRTNNWNLLLCETHNYLHLPEPIYRYERKDISYSNSGECHRLVPDTVRWQFVAAALTAKEKLLPVSAWDLLLYIH